jgi:hypothetical protein
MSSDSHDNRPVAVEIEEFVLRFFEHHGAAVERGPRGLEVLMPESLSDRLGTAEHIRMKSGPDDQAASETGPPWETPYQLAFGSELLEKIIHAACTGVPRVTCRLAFHYLKSQGFDALVRGSFHFSGCVVRVEQWAKITSQYLFLTCRYVAQSDEQKEGLICLPFHLDTGACVPAMMEGFHLTNRTFVPDSKLPPWSEERFRRLIASIKKEAGSALMREISLFEESMNRRFGRDIAHLEEYYAGLEREMKSSLERSGLSDQFIRERQEKIALIPDEMARKRDDLHKKYSIRLKVVPRALMIVSMPALQVLCRVSIGKKQKSIPLFYNPVTKSMDPAVCDGCGASAARIALCDRFHLLCPTCAARCPICHGS